eukprot:3203694-Rhodomonas_salina.1
MAAVAMIYHNKQLQNLQSNKFKSQELSGRQKREEEMADKLMNDMRGHDPRQTETPLTRWFPLLHHPSLSRSAAAVLQGPTCTSSPGTVPAGGSIQSDFLDASSPQKSCRAFALRRGSGAGDSAAPEPGPSSHALSMR